MLHAPNATRNGWSGQAPHTFTSQLPCVQCARTFCAATRAPQRPETGVEGHSPRQRGCHPLCVTRPVLPHVVLSRAARVDSTRSRATRTSAPRASRRRARWSRGDMHSSPGAGSHRELPVPRTARGTGAAWPRYAVSAAKIHFIGGCRSPFWEERGPPSW